MVEVRLRFTLLSLLLLPTAFAAGWWLGARTGDARIATIEQREREIDEVAHALNGATFINLACQTMEISPETRSRRWNTLLLSELLFLARAEPYGTKSQEDVFLMHASNALDLLRVNDQNAFTRAVENASLVDGFKAPFLDKSNDEYDATTDFIRRAFAKRRSQPSFPVKVWLEAIVNNDPGLLETAFSDRITSEQEDWDRRIKTYQQQLANDLGSFDKHKFSFGYTTWLDQEGEVQVGYKGKDYCTFRIIRQGAGWRLDEFWRDAEPIDAEPSDEREPE